MSAINIQAITDLSESLYGVLPVRTISSCEELDKFLKPKMQERLQEPIIFPNEREMVAAQAEKAIKTWQLIEQIFLEKIHLERIAFLDAVSNLQSSEVFPDSLKRILPNCYGVIFNVEWVNAFAWQLPILFPKEIERFHNIGKMMAGIFYLERYNKAGRTISDALKAERISTLMKIIRFTDNRSNKMTSEATDLATDLLNKVGNLLSAQKQMKLQEVERIITETKPHVARIEEDQKKQALKFNIFSALGVTRKEVIQSRFLAYLLDPNEHHCQEGIFLNAFLKKIDLPEISTKKQMKKVRVEIEYSAGEDLGRMDIILFCKPEWLIVIENKVDAGEGEEQLPRYAEWLKKPPGYNNRMLIFLTPTGHESVTGKASNCVDLQLSYLHLAEAFSPMLDLIEAESVHNLIEAESVRIVLTQYITICNYIGGMDMTTQDKELFKLLTKPENIKIALEIEQQTQLLRKQVAKEFCEKIQKILQSKLESANLGLAWKAFYDVDVWNTQSYMYVGIRTVKHQTKPNYRMVAEMVSPKNLNRLGWHRPQWIDLKNQPSEALDIINLTIKMKNDGCNEGDGYWLGSKDLNDEKIAFILTDIDDIVACLEDNNTEDHPLANRIADELWSMFTTYREDIEALDSFKQAAS